MKHSIKLDTQWRFKQVTEEEWLQAKVPGCVHTDLLANGKMTDPFYGKNELDHQWIDKVDWMYETTFDLSEDMLDEEHIELEFMGLDTYADIQLNGQQIVLTNNMFRIWRPINIHSWSTMNINDFYIHQQTITEQSAQLTAEIEVEAIEEWIGNIELTTDGFELKQAVHVKQGKKYYKN